MSIRKSITSIIFFLPFCASAQEDITTRAQQLQTLPEEVVITGDRSLGQLHTRMLEAEQKAYDVFNKFNDDKRFRITCGLHQPTGSRLSRQVCQAGFEREATRSHAQDYLANFIDPNSQAQHPQIEAALASQQQEYREKIKQVAEEHPEFLDAVIQFAQTRERYESATSTSKE